MTTQQNVVQSTIDEKIKKYSGSCHCQACRFECTGSPIFRVICHCSICTRLSGGIAVAFVGFENSQLEIIAGSDHLQSYKATDRMERFRCRICGSNVYNQSLLVDRQFRDTPLTNFQTDDHGVIIELDQLKPDGHINFERCQNCYSDMFKYDGLVKFSAMPGSAVIENHPSSIANSSN